MSHSQLVSYILFKDSANYALNVVRLQTECEIILEYTLEQISVKNGKGPGIPVAGKI